MAENAKPAAKPKVKLEGYYVHKGVIYGPGDEDKLPETFVVPTKKETFADLARSSVLAAEIALIEAADKQAAEGTAAKE